MDLKKHRPLSEKPEKGIFILKGACAAGSQCRHYATGGPVGFSACEKCVFHLDCAQGPADVCVQCHVTVGVLDTAPFRRCFRRGCAAKAQGLCKNCTAALTHAVKKRADMLGTVSAQSLEDYIAQNPGYSDLPRALVSICASLMRTALHADWQYDVRPSGDMWVPCPPPPPARPGVPARHRHRHHNPDPDPHPSLSFGKVVLEEHLRNPRPMQLSALVAAAGYGHVATKAVTQLRREIAGHPQTWSLKGDRVFLMKRDAVEESPDGMLGFLRKRSTEAVPAFAAIGLYGTAAGDLCSLITEGQAEAVDSYIFATWKSPPPLGPRESADTRLERWRRALKQRKPKPDPAASGAGV